MNPIIIRETHPEDAEAVLNYLKLVGGETDNLTFGSEGMPISIQQESAFIQSVLDNERALMLSAWDGDKIVAEASLSPLPRRMRHRAELGVTVAKAYWNQGLGTKLLTEIISFARRSGTQIINLEVRSTNESAIHLYEKLGFQKIGVFPAFLKIEEQYADAIFMYLDLREKKQ